MCDLISIMSRAAASWHIRSGRIGCMDRSRGTRVAYYRLYLLSGPDGRFVGFEEIEAVDDVEAARLAEAHLGPRPLELWCGKRKVKTFPATAAED